jgi:hypothetical protein
MSETEATVILVPVVAGCDDNDNGKVICAMLASHPRCDPCYKEASMPELPDMLRLFVFLHSSMSMKIT